jgi:GT2 family glycosyltransferase
MSFASRPTSQAGPTSVRFFVTVVLYRMRLEEAPTLWSLRGAADALVDSTILVWDNGPEVQDLAVLSDWGSVALGALRYVHAPHNAGLPQVYGTAIERSAGHDVLVWLDQDTEVPADYFDAVRRAVVEHPDCAVFLPLVVSHGRIVSPGDYRWVKGRHWKRPRIGRLPSRGLTAVNSGMAVRRSYLTEEFAGYDPRLRFYGVDTAFMLDHARRRPTLVVLDCRLGHASALLDRDAPPADRVRRHAALFEAWVALHRSNPVRRAAVAAYVLYVGLRESLRSRDGRFAAVAWSAARGRHGD